jgi:hypothetical protein
MVKGCATVAGMTSTRKAGPGLRSKAKTRAQTATGRGLVTKRKDGTVYHQDRMRWPAALGTFRYTDQPSGATTVTTVGDAGKYEVPAR